VKENETRTRGTHAYSNLVGKSEGKRTLGRSRNRWEGSVGMDLRGYGGKVWTGFKWFRIRTSGTLL
jgi:hypothetical protein